MGKADTVLTLSQPLEVWGQRGARVRAARAEAQAAALRGSQSRSDVASQLARSARPDPRCCGRRQREGQAGPRTAAARGAGAERSGQCHRVAG
ncbi:hypothetical protein G6F60_015441 [Rhizopus arrhizus]|nr:hypothetical protein G6F60_015441 [Rhizopus arrhizus]